MVPFPEEGRKWNGLRGGNVDGLVYLPGGSVNPLFLKLNFGGLPGGIYKDTVPHHFVQSLQRPPEPKYTEGSPNLSFTFEQSLPCWRLTTAGVISRSRMPIGRCDVSRKTAALFANAKTDAADN